MFCYQCEQRAKEEGCTKSGVCGKSPNAALLQDLLLEVSKGISSYAYRAAKLGKRDKVIDRFVLEALFTTITNVNFDEEDLAGMVDRAGDMRRQAKVLYEAACTERGETPEALDNAAVFQYGDTMEQKLSVAKEIGVEAMQRKEGEDIAGVKQMILYGLKGAAAYLYHAEVLDVWDDETSLFFHECMDFLTKKGDMDALLGMALKTGEVNLKVMELLDKANTETYGHPEPTQMLVSAKKGKCILVSGHDYKDLKALLEQTEGKGINVYTHGEMLPANAYPELKKFPHLIGNYGSAWQNQRKEFEAFPGAILMTTNCIQRPKDAYQARIFTTDLVQWPGVTHIEGYDFSPVIEAALAEEGFGEDEPEERIPMGFGRNAVLGVADKVIDAVKAGAIKHFFLVGGCDGAKPGRNYYTEFVEKTPADTVVLTLACGKFRFNRLQLGEIGGLPRLMDIGQCNDAYSAIVIASALADAFGTDVNGLPLSFILSWYEQKAVAILLTLLHLGIKNMRLGPTLPSFVTPAVLNVLVEKFGIMPISDVEEDMKACLA